MSSGPGTLNLSLVEVYKRGKTSGGIWQSTRSQLVPIPAYSDMLIIHIYIHWYYELLSIVINSTLTKLNQVTFIPTLMADIK